MSYVILDARGVPIKQRFNSFGDARTGLNALVRSKVLRRSQVTIVRKDGDTLVPDYGWDEPVDAALTLVPS